MGLDGVCVGFGLVGSLGWVGMVGSGGGLVGNRLFGCFCYRFVGVLVGFFFFFFGVFGFGGILVGGGQWWCGGHGGDCLVVEKVRER